MLSPGWGQPWGTAKKREKNVLINTLMEHLKWLSFYAEKILYNPKPRLAIKTKSKQKSLRIRFFVLILLIWYLVLKTQQCKQ